MNPQIMTEEEIIELLSEIDTREIYEEVMSFIYRLKYPFPFTDSEMEMIAQKMQKDADAGKGISIEDVRKKYL